MVVTLNPLAGPVSEVLGHMGSITPTCVKNTLCAPDAPLSAELRDTLWCVADQSSREFLSVVELDAWARADEYNAPWLLSPYAEAHPALEGVRRFAVYSLYWCTSPMREEDPRSRQVVSQTFTSQLFATRQARKYRKTFGRVLARVDFLPAGLVGI